MVTEKWKKGDEIEMKVDFIRSDLSFKVNDNDYQHAFPIMSNREWTAAISIGKRENRKSGFALMFYQEFLY